MRYQHGFYQTTAQRGREDFRDEVAAMMERPQRPIRGRILHTITIELDSTMADNTLILS